jgi:hypothetical protein
MIGLTLYPLGKSTDVEIYKRQLRYPTQYEKLLDNFNYTSYWTQKKATKIFSCLKNTLKPKF